MIIDDKTITRTIINLDIRNSKTGEQFYPTEEAINKITLMFKSLMKEEKNKNLSPLNQQSLIEGIAQSWINGENKWEAFSFRSDNAHMAGYDNALKQGEGERILNILNSYNLGAEELKGVALFQPYEGKAGKSGRVYIKEEIENPDGESPFIKLFEIYIDGNLVYQWKGTARGVGDIYEKINEKQEEIRQPKRKSEYKGSIYISDFERPIKAWVDKNGRTFYTQGSKRVPARWVE